MIAPGRHAQPEQPPHLPAEREQQYAGDIAGEVEQFGQRGRAGQAEPAQGDQAGGEEAPRSRAEKPSYAPIAAATGAYWPWDSLWCASSSVIRGETRK